MKVLIVDDSLIYRKTIQKALSDYNNIKIIGSVWNGKKAIEFIKNQEIPDLITLDVEMPEMDGLETLIEIQEFNKIKGSDIKVLMISSLTHSGAKITVEALQNGAFDYILKPETDNASKSFSLLKKNLSEKLEYLSEHTINICTDKFKPNLNLTAPFKKSGLIKAIVLGISTGGPKALIEFLPGLCEKTDLPIFIVQHMPPGFTKSLADSLDKKCKHNVVEASGNEIISKNYVYIAPGGKHMIVRENEKGNRITAVIDTPPVNKSKPSVDVLFRSVTNIYGGELIALILTGMGNDGSKSVGSLKRAGAYVLVQDEATSVVWGMPGSAVKTGYVDYIVPLDKMTSVITEIINNK